MRYSEYIEVLPVLVSRLFPFVSSFFKDFVGGSLVSFKVSGFGSTVDGHGGNFVDGIWFSAAVVFDDDVPAFHDQFIVDLFPRYLRSRLIDEGDSDSGVFDLYCLVFNDIRVEVSRDSVRFNFDIGSHFEMSRFSRIYGVTKA